MNDSMIGRYLAARAKAAARGDRSVVAECDVHLRRYGWRAEMTDGEAEVVEGRAEADARPRRGRPPARRDLPAADV